MRIFFSLWKSISFVGISFIKISCLVTGLIAISLLFVMAYQYFLTSPHIQLKQVVVTGVNDELKGELLEVAQLRFDLSLLAVDLGDLKQRLQKHPWVRSVQLEKRFPHTLLIQVEKEEPMAIVVMDQLHYMDRYGKTFKVVEPDEDMDYPIVTGVFTSREAREKGLKLASRILNTLEAEHWEHQDISEIHVSGAGIVFLYLGHLPGVIRVRGEELHEKIGAFKSVMDHLKKTGRIHTVKGINLDYEDGVVVSLKKG